ncbi:MAG: class I SAM-dependent methyltransferase [Bacteroidetes bacterium]|nr:class I SAM-dependent methyltransferase [Bacteroidota bacterium]
MSNVLSPLTGKPSTLVAQFPAEEVISLYKKELGVDVSRFFRNDPLVSIYECVDSGYKFYFPFSFFGDENFYAELEKQEGYYPQWKWENESALKFISEGDHLLDVGCGGGAFIHQLLSKKKITAIGIDTNSKAIAAANAMHENTFIVSDIGTLPAKHKNSFDVITCFQVLEHIWEPLSFLEQLLSFLKKKGTLIIAVPNNHPYLYEHDMMHTLNLPPHHAGLWNEHSLGFLQKLFPLEKISSEIQPIGEQLNYYEMVQLAHLEKKSPVFRSAIGKKIATPIYGKFIRAGKKKIKGHSIVIAFRKTT